MTGHANAEGKLPINTGKRNLIRSRSLLLGALLLTACEPEAGADKPRQHLVVADVILTVNNRSERAVQISLESDTLDHQLGNVARRASRSFSLPSALVGTRSVLRLKAVLDGAQPVRSDAFEVRRGQKVVWTFDDTGQGTVVRQ